MNIRKCQICNQWLQKTENQAYEKYLCVSRRNEQLFYACSRQYHLDVDDDDSYIDLLLFHRRLRCLIAIELKIGEFKPEYAGKMQYYLSVLDETVKLPDEIAMIITGIDSVEESNFYE